MTKAPLPTVLQEIADVAGDAAALAIAARHGGRRVYFPAESRLFLDDPRDTYWLVDCVGVDAARKICKHFEVDGRGQRIEIPLHVGGTYRQFVRSIAERIHELDGENLSSAEIARRVGLTQRTVHRHRARHGARKNDKQGKLL